MCVCVCVCVTEREYIADDKHISVPNLCLHPLLQMMKPACACGIIWMIVGGTTHEGDVRRVGRSWYDLSQQVRPAYNISRHKQWCLDIPGLWYDLIPLSSISSLVWTTLPHCLISKAPLHVDDTRIAHY